MQLPVSVLAASVLRVALKFLEKVDKSCDVLAIMRKVSNVAGIEDDLVYRAACKELLVYTRNFDKTHPLLKNVNNQHADLTALLYSKNEQQ